MNSKADNNYHCLEKKQKICSKIIHRKNKNRVVSPILSPADLLQTSLAHGCHSKYLQPQAVSAGGLLLAIEAGALCQTSLFHPSSKT